MVSKRKKILGIIFLCLIFVIGITIGIVIGVKNNSNENQSNDTTEVIDRKKEIYLLAKESGYEGTYEEWLESIRGDEIELAVSDGYLNWKYKQQVNWVQLISLSTLAGADGKNIELSTNTEYIIWKYEGSNDWNDLISLDLLKGSSGKNAYELAKDAGYTGTVEQWLSSLKGGNGESIELQATETEIQWKYSNETDWTSLISLSKIKGSSAYDTYCESHPSYSKTEDEWIEDLVNGNLATKKEYTVTFNSDGGTSIDPVTVVSGGKITAPTTPTKSGYTFDGWYVGDEKWVFSGCVVTENMTLKAKWHETYTEGLGFILVSSTEYGVYADHVSYNAAVVIPSVYNGKK